MRKLIAVFLAALLLLAVIPTAAFAKISNEDAIMNELLNGPFEHVDYVDANDGFRTRLTLYGITHLDTWGDYFTKASDADAAKAILLALIDKIEAEYNNETYETILAALKGVSTVADLVNKVDEYTGILNIAQNTGWATSLTVLNNVIKAANFANDEYEKFVEGYAVILSVQAASVYYGELLDYIIENTENTGIRNAATELKNDITISLEEARDQLIRGLTADAGEGAVSLGVSIAMSSFGVTATIQTVYNAVTGIGNMLFNSTEMYEYMVSLSLIREIESLIPGYFNSVKNNEDPESVVFAKIAILTLRETGEKMLSNLGKVKGDSIVNKLFNNTQEATELIQNGALSVAKLNVYRDIILDEEEHTSYQIKVDTTPGKNFTVRHPDGTPLATMKNARESHLINEFGAFYSTYDSTLGKFVRVVVTFVDDCTFEYTSSSSSSSSGGSSSSGSGGGFFASFIKAIQDFFAALLSIFKF